MPSWCGQGQHYIFHLLPCHVSRYLWSELIHPSSERWTIGPLEVVIHRYIILPYHKRIKNKWKGHFLVEYITLLLAAYPDHKATEGSHLADTGSFSRRTENVKLVVSRHADNSWQTIYSAGYWTRPLCNEVSGLPVTYRTMNSVRSKWQVWNLGLQNVVRGILILYKLMSRVSISATLVNQLPQKWTSSNGHTNVPEIFFMLCFTRIPL